ncbi:pentapeptide repeat-containing protein [Streptomyces sp. NPDC001635]
MAHLAEADRDAYLASLTPGADIDHRGTSFTASLLDKLFEALRDPRTGKPQMGTAGFNRAEFSGDVWFGEAVFLYRASFSAACFLGDADFRKVHFSDNTDFFMARFSGAAMFSQAQFSGRAAFQGARFSERALFAWTRFDSEAGFHGANIAGAARFDLAQFSGAAGFRKTKFADEANFQEARFTVAPELGPLTCNGIVNFSGAVFEAPVTLAIAARQVLCERTRWESTATIRLRYARTDVSHAVLSAPVAVTSHPARFTVRPGEAMDETLLSDCREEVQVTSIQGVDAAHLVLTDIDLSACLFAGAFHLDQLRLEGGTTFAPAPSGWHRRGIRLTRWTRRRTLAEEHHWRAQNSNQPAPSLSHPLSSRQWHPGPHHPDPGLTPGPQDVAALYRHLRKAFEDGKNEPVAADFYYGEMEMRRHDRTGTTRAERGLLHSYWLFSGYGLRASRALGWLAVAMLVTIVLLMGFGLPQDSPKQEATGTVPQGGGRVTFQIDKDDPKNPTGNRFTGERLEKSLNVTLNSVVFRSSGQDLTTAGTYIEMTSRLLEPTLLALAALAVRGRIKR